MNIAEEKDFQNSCLLDTEKIRRSSVLVIGAGGLGCNIAVHLAGAGVGKIGLCDFDTVSKSNLNRQFIYSFPDIGMHKAQVSAKVISRYALDCTVEAITEKVTEHNAEDIIEQYDIVILACDNIKTRLVTNKACVKLKKPLVDSGISGACGRVYLYIPDITACVNCITDSTKESTEKRTISAAAGIIGGFAAMVALRFLSGIKTDEGKMILIDSLNNTIEELPVKKSDECKICGGD